MIDPLDLKNRGRAALVAALLVAGLGLPSSGVQLSRAPSGAAAPSASGVLLPGRGSLPAQGSWGVLPSGLAVPSLSGAGLVSPAAPSIVLQGTPSQVPVLPVPFIAAEPAAEQASLVGRVRDSVDRQLVSMGDVLGDRGHPLLRSVSSDARVLLDQLQARLDAGDIDPSRGIRASGLDPVVPGGAGPVKVGVYPVTADPFHWGHLLIGLQAAGTLGLDKVVFVLAGDDPRKPSMTRAAIRHPMGQAVLAAFAPFFGYSSIAAGTNLDGETNMFRLLALNAGRAVHAFYLVGADHYKFKDKNGNPDTLPKIEANMKDPALGFDSSLHRVSVAFIERDGRGPEVPTRLDVRFLPSLPFDASSTQARAGNLALMPYDAYRYVRDRLLGLYGIPVDQPAAQ